jgi:hypothetical protein
MRRHPVFMGGVPMPFPFAPPGFGPGVATSEEEVAAIAARLFAQAQAQETKVRRHDPL